ncbi:MAG: glycoside hydrolase family 9 protein [Bacteroidales bacterium]|nr:glycoside hydrolase family 9 protein [Bacteroidales bacterium]MCF8390868.1 glycoside hydrolase family 9 protein [Bacteroidales bacterium]
MKNTVYLFIASIFILFACQTPKTITKTDSENIRLNQLGYYPASVKQFIIVDMNVSDFDIINEENKVVFSGELTQNGLWEASGEEVSSGDFTVFNEPGKYRILLNDSVASYPFEIKDNLYEEALNAAIKSYYFQRASMPIDESYGGIYKRAAGHPDDKCLYHPSSGKTTGTLNSPGGWYDAGDYGKYIVNASLSVGQMLNLIEIYPDAISDGALNIPESGNGVSDLWDELKYELDWILSMQDDDGGVYFKLTALHFGGFIMPEDYNLDRYIIGKGTASTLNFAAVLAQASRLYQNIDSSWSEKALEASKKAWKWAVLNTDVPFKNPKDVSTGEYGDDIFSDDFYWAATELYITTREETYQTYLTENPIEYAHKLTDSWKSFVRNNAFHSLLDNKNLLNEELASSLNANHLSLAESIIEKIDTNPYRIALEQYEWGSNSDILNQAMILCMAHRISGEEKYLTGAEQINDYIFGKNATGYSFLTGYGSKQVMFPHHRPSGADGIDMPIPGFIAGGPNAHKQDKQNVTYTSEFPAKAYIDEQASFASNEVCLNWNAPAVFVMAYLQQVRK